MKGKVPAHTQKKAATTDRYKSGAPQANQSKTHDDYDLMRTIGDYKKGGAGLSENR
jgi:hypothetical protein